MSLEKIWVSSYNLESIIMLNIHEIIRNSFKTKKNISKNPGFSRFPLIFSLHFGISLFPYNSLMLEWPRKIGSVANP